MALPSAPLPTTPSSGTSAYTALDTGCWRGRHMSCTMLCRCGDRMPTDTATEGSCYSGVFMENVVGGTDGD